MRRIGNLVRGRRLAGLLALVALTPVPAWGEPAQAASAVPAGGLSPGCRSEPPAAPPAGIVVDGRMRDLITVLPEGYRPDRPHQLVLAFHGRTSSNVEVRAYYDLEPHAERPTIFVYPAGLRSEDGGYSWSDPGDASDRLRDYRLFDAVLRTMGALYCIDPGRVFAVGHSLGGWFANSLGCARGRAVRAVATVAGGISPSECEAPTAAAILHHPDDRLVAFELGRAALDLYLAETEADPDATDDVDGRRALVQDAGLVCRQYVGDPAHPVLWCPHLDDVTRSGRYYPHQWPPGAGELIMDFFASLPPTVGEPGASRAPAPPPPKPA